MASPEKLSRPAPQAGVLVVDLDFSLLKTDLLWEAMNQLISRRPYKIPQAISWLFQGKIALKERLVGEIVIDPKSLPYNTEVLAEIAAAQERGQKIALATASPLAWAEAVATELGVFDQVFASADGINLKSERKRDALVAAYGAQGFDYLGDSRADLTVWEQAAGAYPVTYSQRFASRVSEVTSVRKTLTPNRDYHLLTAIWGSMRAHQWVKNLLVFLPLVASHSYSQSPLILQAILAFIAFSLTASAVYLVNDLVDVWHDRRHSTKRNRPIASGNLNIVYAWVVWVVLLLAAVGVSLWLPLNFGLSLLTYFGLTLLYSFYLKQKPIADGLTLGLLYTMRVLAGAWAIQVALSFWLLAFAIFFFMSLALLKRYSELLNVNEVDQQLQLPGRGYRVADLPLVLMIGVAAGMASTLILALFVHDQETIEQYRTPEFLWLMIPLVIFWICRAWLKGHRGIMLEDPVVWALKDYASWILIGLIGLSFVGARWLEVGWLM